MKKKLLLKSMLLLCALVAGMSSAWGATYVKVTSTTDLVDGGVYILGNASGIATSYASKLPTTNSGYTESSGTITTSTASPLEFTLGSLGDNKYTLKINGGNYLGYNSGTNFRNSETAATNTKEQWTITYNSTCEVYTIVNVATNTRFIGYSGSNTFGPYATSNMVTTGTYAPATLYKKQTATGEATTVTINASGITNTDIASGTAAGSFSAVVKDASSNTIDGASVTWTSSKPAIATINVLTGAVTLVKKGTTTITATYDGENGKYQSSSETYELTVTNSNAGEGTAAKPFSVTEARDALDASEIDAEETYYVKGYIAKIGSLSNGALTYWISDDGSMTNNVQCYKGKNVGGAAFTAETDLEVGDIATVKGKLKIYQTTTYELDENNEVVSITPRTKVNIATFTATTTTLVLGTTETTETTVTNDQSGWTPVSYTYESDDTDVATVNASGVITAVAKGTANITVSPVVSATDPTYKVGESKSIKITVQNPSHTATFSVNGTTSESSVEEGEAITFPDDPADFGGKKFVGWAEATITGTTNTAPSFVESATMGTADVTYYAVFASGTETEGWKKLAASEVSEEGTYALLTTDGHAFNGSISSGHGQVTTDAFSFVNDVATSAPTGTCEITLKAVTGGYTMYNADKGYLYATKAGSGGLDWHDSEDNYWSYTSENDGNWIYSKNYSGSKARLRSYTNSSFRTYNSNNGSILVFAQKTMIASYSDYCTTFIPEPSDPVASGETISLTTTESMAGWRTFYDADQAYTVDEKTKIYVVKAKTATANVVELTALEATAIPAAAPVILKTSASNRTMVLTKADNADALGDNLLTVTDGTNDADGYRLGYREDTGVAFFQYQATKPAAGIVYIAASNVTTSGVGAPAYITIGGEATGVNDVQSKTEEARGEYFNLAGQRVAQPTKGLYIVNGRKVVVK